MSAFIRNTAFKNINLCALLSCFFFFLLTCMLLCSLFFQVIYFILLLFYFVIILLRFWANFDIKSNIHLKTIYSIAKTFLLIKVRSPSSGR